MHVASDEQLLTAARKRIPALVTRALRPDNNEEEDLHCMMFAIYRPDGKLAEMLEITAEDREAGEHEAARIWGEEGWDDECIVGFIGYSC